jgi:superfamily II DNA or RNA helicase/HKD family nuclease
MSVTDPGPRDHLVRRALEQALAELSPDLIDERRLDPAEAPARLARHALEEIGRILDKEEPADQQARRVNDVLRRLAGGEAAAASEVALPARILNGIRSRTPLGDPAPLAPLPATPLSQSDLLVNAEGQPNMGSELRAELATADSVDLICAFVIWSGVRHLRDALSAVVERGGRVRVITTTYMGATEPEAVDALNALGAEVRVALDARTTKLHAKAWLLERGSGLSTAFVGSSNLSHTALFDGLEWNVRLSSVDAPHVLDRVRMTFESHWASEHFELYDPDVNGDDLRRALREHDRRSLGERSTISFANLDVRPYPHQQRMLDTLTTERERHDRHRNLVVAATGTGKTVVAALDYRQLTGGKGGTRPSLLFVAHREEILRQSLATYRAVLRDGAFGEIHGGGRIAAGKHVFAMVQSLHRERLESIAPDGFAIVVIDEFHHAAAATYDRLLSHLKPVELLGLTGTPERLDGKDVTEWFDQRIAVELRLWEAIDQGFLVPFQYFGVADGTDLSSVTWRRGNYATDELSKLLSNDDLRVGKLLESVRQIVRDPSRMRALGFCVSIEHARYMARKFQEAGLESVALTGEDGPDVRSARLRDLRESRLNCIFSVEVLGEGVDVPDVDCLLLLRPTASATVFSQQLGRGLRRAQGKSHLTVIDLIGQHRREFRFEQRFRAIVDTRRGSVRQQVENDFPFLPAGCTVDLDRKSREAVLENLRAAAGRSRWASLIADVRTELDSTRLIEFLERQDHRVEDVYRSGRSWTQLRREGGLATSAAGDSTFETTSLRALGRITHVDDPERVALYRSWLEEDRPPDLDRLNPRETRLLIMLAWGLGSGSAGADDLSSYLDSLWAERAVREELVQLIEVTDARSTARAIASGLVSDIPLALHARYSRQEIVAALGSGTGVKPKVTQGGILWVDEAKSDVFFIDLHKAERDYSPTTMYRDYAINRELFHWESQSRQSPQQPTVQRYIEHRSRGTNVLLFVRERKVGELGTLPFTFLGPATYVSHQGERPVAFTWKLPAPMPEELFEVARSVAAA